jgi:hypothetical protein
MQSQPDSMRGDPQFIEPSVRFGEALPCLNLLAALKLVVLSDQVAVARGEFLKAAIQTY